MVWIRQLWSQLGTSVKEMFIFFFFFSLAAFFPPLSHLLIFSQFHRLLNTVNRCIRCSRILIRYTVIALKMQHLTPSGRLEVPTRRFCMHKLLHVLKLTQRMLLLLKDLDGSVKTHCLGSFSHCSMSVKKYSEESDFRKRGFLHFTVQGPIIRVRGFEVVRVVGSWVTYSRNEYRRLFSFLSSFLQPFIYEEKDVTYLVCYNLSTNDQY